MGWEPQGLMKYECCTCEKRFLVGLVDNDDSPPSVCPFCRSNNIEAISYIKPDNDDDMDLLERMGCAGIYYDPDEEEGDSD
jgi:DNA-directed RNA polymerase subunit RPC12/RpoP